MLIGLDQHARKRISSQRGNPLLSMGTKVCSTSHLPPKGRKPGGLLLLEGLDRWMRRKGGHKRNLSVYVHYSYGQKKSNVARRTWSSANRMAGVPHRLIGERRVHPRP